MSKDEEDERVKAITPEANIVSGFTESLVSSELGELANIAGETILDSVLSEGLLRDIPVLGAVMGVGKIGMAVRDQLYLRKLSAFLVTISKYTSAEREKAFENISQGRDQSETAEVLLDSLEKADSTRASTILGSVFGQLLEGTINSDEFWRAVFAINSTPSRLILEIPYLSLANVVHPTFREQVFANAGLGSIGSGFGALVFAWDKKMHKIFNDAVRS